ncbi:MAG: hypothetical protein JSU98_13695 [Gemmatimonadales bacterium]|jgi:uncharacterized protein (DUF433 family)|nr:MAG: hypothetical protein JSU98_13695 [Gemmatimonadales bacterium]
MILDSSGGTVSTNQHSIRIPSDLDRLVEAERARNPRMSWSDQVVELLDEAIRVRRCPGIVFRDGAVGRRAVVEGTGVDVWAVVLAWQDCAAEWDALREEFSMLDEVQLRAALNYHALYPSEIDERIAREREWTAERLAAELPFAQGLPG